jgi:hypothetical protein
MHTLRIYLFEVQDFSRRKVTRILMYISKVKTILHTKRLGKFGEY